MNTDYRARAIKAARTRQRRRRKARSSRGALVKAYAEGLSGVVLEKFPEAFKAVVGKKSGIYILTKQDKAYYVGLARKLRDRLKRHLEDRHRGKWDSFSLYSIGRRKYLRDIESILIRVLRPEGNAVGAQFGRERDLTKRLRSEIQEWVDIQLRRF